MPSADAVKQLLDRERAAGRWVVPSLPDIALRIGDLCRRDDVDARRLAQEIGKDPAIATRLIAAANSVAIRGSGKPVDNLTTAVTRLGLQLCRVLIQRMTMEQMFCAKSPTLNRWMRRTWSLSVEVAALSRVLARHFTHIDAETALLAGLVHRVGVLPIIRQIDLHFRMEEDRPDVDEALKTLHPAMGTEVLRSWSFPPELVLVPEAVATLGYTHDGPADVVDIVIVALAQLNIEGNDRALNDIPSFAKLGVSVTHESVMSAAIPEDYASELELLRA